MFNDDYDYDREFFADLDREEAEEESSIEEDNSMEWDN
jgi:hypothetical protein